MKQKFTAAALILAGLALAGCGDGITGSQNGTPSEDLYEHTKTLTDGRTVTCIVYHELKKGGLSCDWAGAK